MQAYGRVSIPALLAGALAIGVIGFGVVRWNRGAADAIAHDLAATLARAPAGAVGVAAIADFPTWRTQAGGTAFARALADPELERRLLLATAGSGQGPDAADPWAQLRPILDGMQDLLVSAFPLPDGRLAFGLSVVATDPGTIVDWIDRQLVDQGQDSAERDGVVPRCGSSWCRAVRDRTVHVATSIEALTQLLSTPDPQTVTSFAAAAARLRAEPAGLFAHLDLQRLLGVLGSGVDDSLGGNLGLDALTSISWTEAVDGDVFHGRGRLDHRSPRPPLLALLLDTPNRPPTFDRAIPAQIDGAIFGPLDDPAATWDRIVEQLTQRLPEEHSTSLQQGLGMAALLGVDVRNDLFATLGGEIAVAYRLPAGAIDPDDPTAALAESNFCLLVGVVDGARLEALLSRLDATGMALVRQTAGGRIRELALPIPGAPTLAIGLGPNRLVIAAPAEDAEALLEGAPAPLADDPEYGKLRARLPSEGGYWSYAKSSATQLEPLLPLLAGGDDGLALSRRAFADLSDLASGIEALRRATGAIPLGSDAATIASQLEPYLQEVPTTDPWSRPYRLRVDGDSYLLWSAGADGADDQDWSSCLTSCPELRAILESTNEDVVVANGEFVRWPDDSATAQVSPELAAVVERIDQLAATLPAALGVSVDRGDAIEWDTLAPLPIGASGGLAAWIAGTWTGLLPTSEPNPVP